MSDVDRRIKRLEDKSRQGPKQHEAQAKKFSVMVKDPDHIADADLGEGEVVLVRDIENDKYYIIARIEGAVKKSELT